MKHADRHTQNLFIMHFVWSTYKNLFRGQGENLKAANS